MKLRIPAGCGAVSHLGRSLEIADDNSIEVDDADWPVFSAHGFRPWAEAQDPLEVASMNREELIVAVMNATLRALQTIGTEEIRTRLMASEASVLPFEQTSDATVAAVDANVEAVSTLSRQGLFAFLKGRGVSVSIPVTNEELRAMARQAMGLA